MYEETSKQSIFPKPIPMTYHDLSVQEILNALHSNVAVLDGDGNITHVNEAWARFSEERGALPSSTGVGANYFAVCRARGAAPEVEEILTGIRAVIDEAIPQFRAQYTCNTPKETYWFELMTKPLAKPHRGAVVYHTDITELKKAKDEYAVILNGARGILWRAKLPGFQTIFTSKHVETILGYSVQAWTVQPDLWINRIHPEDREWVLAFTAQATEEGRSHDFEYRMISADEQTVWLRNIVNVVIENGRPKEVVGISVDITERKLAEERLRESEERFRTLAEAIPQLCWMAHGDGHRFWYNQRWYTYTGTTPEQMEGWGWQSVHDPQILPLVLERLKTSIATGEPFDMVLPLKAANGEFHPFLTRATPVKDSKGSVVGWFGTNTDVTELRDTQEALRTSEERLRLALQAARIGTFEWNLRTGVNTWTPELESLYGLPPGGFGGTQTAFENLVHPDDLPKVRQLIDETLKTGCPMHGEWRTVWADRSVHWIAARWQTFADESGGPARVVGVHIDVTERNSAEEALRKSEEKFRRVVEHIGDALFVDNFEGQVVFANERFLNLFGYSREELPDIKLEDYVAPEYRATLRDRHDQRVRGEAVPTHFEYEGFRRDGKRMWLEADVVPVTDENGNRIGTQSALRDVTERKRAEEALSGMTRKLLEAQEQERTRIARELHDDINQRMALLAIEVQRWSQQLPESAVDLHGHIHHACQRLSELSRDIQALSHRLHSSKLEYLGIVTAIKSFCKELSEHHKVVVNFIHSNIPDTVPAEISLCLFRVTQEALQNAVKHSGSRHFSVELRSTGEEIHLTVSDLGAGFEPQEAMNRRGLGLISMRERLRLVGGELSITSQPKRGTTIHARVPILSTS